MSKIMINGVEYVGASGDSTNVGYSDTSGTLDSTNVHDAIDQMLVKIKSNGDSANIEYSDTTGEISVTNVHDAIDQMLIKIKNVPSEAISKITEAEINQLFDGTANGGE